jgi:hypothetical protein
MFADVVCSTRSESVTTRYANRCSLCCFSVYCREKLSSIMLPRYGWVTRVLPIVAVYIASVCFVDFLDMYAPSLPALCVHCASRRNTLQQPSQSPAFVLPTESSQQYTLPHSRHNFLSPICYSAFNYCNFLITLLFIHLYFWACLWSFDSFMTIAL